MQHRQCICGGKPIIMDSEAILLSPENGKKNNLPEKMYMVVCNRCSISTGYHDTKAEAWADWDRKGKA